jgi:hypothetical protein
VQSQDTRLFYLVFLQTMVAGGFRPLPTSDYDVKKTQAHRPVLYTMGNVACAWFGLIPSGAQVISVATPQ